MFMFIQSYNYRTASCTVLQASFEVKIVYDNLL